MRDNIHSLTLMRNNRDVRKGELYNEFNLPPAPLTSEEVFEPCTLPPAPLASGEVFDLSAFFAILRALRSYYTPYTTSVPLLKLLKL